MGLFSFIGSLFGGGAAKRASRDAEAAQLGYLNQALGEQRRQFDLTRSDFAPYLETGKAGLTQLGDLVGVNGEGPLAAALARLQDSPTLARLISNGENAILANASATGGLRGGNIQRGLADFRADAFNSVLQQQLQRLAGLAGIGQGATDSVSAFGANAANNIANILGNQGQVRAGGILTRGGITNQMWNSAGGFLDNALSAVMGGGSFGNILGKIVG